MGPGPLYAFIVCSTRVLWVPGITELEVTVLLGPCSGGAWVAMCFQCLFHQGPTVGPR